MTKTDAIAAGSSRRALPLLTAPRAAVGVVGAATAAIFLARTLSWPSASSNDAWAYAAWGQALARGEQLIYSAGTTPKPLASLLAAIVSPLPPTRAWAVVVALALGMLVAGLVAAGYREAGILGGSLGAVAFVLVARLDRVLWFSLVDAVTAALVVLSIALRGRARIASLVLAGLLRPEGCAASALAGYVETGGSRLRRLLWAGAMGVLPIALWVAFDFALAGSPLATSNFVQDVGEREVGERLPQSPLEALGIFRSMLFAESGAVFAVVGALGLLVHAWRKQRAGEFPFAPALAVTWAAALYAETIYGLELHARYLLPLVAILALGLGLLIGAFAPPIWNRRPVWIWAAAAVAVAASGLAVARMDFSPSARKAEQASLAVRRSLPAVEPVLDCGRLGFVGRRHVGTTIARLSASTRTSLSRFERVKPGQAGRYAGVLAVDGNETERLPSWPIRETPVGPLAVDPTCPAALG